MESDGSRVTMKGSMWEEIDGSSVNWPTLMVSTPAGYPRKHHCEVDQLA